MNLWATGWSITQNKTKRKKNDKVLTKIQKRQTNDKVLTKDKQTTKRQTKNKNINKRQSVDEKAKKRESVDEKTKNKKNDKVLYLLHPGCCDWRMNSGGHCSSARDDHLLALKTERGYFIFFVYFEWYQNMMMLEEWKILKQILARTWILLVLAWGQVVTTWYNSYCYYNYYN